MGRLLYNSEDPFGRDTKGIDGDRMRKWFRTFVAWQWHACSCSCKCARSTVLDALHGSGFENSLQSVQNKYSGKSARILRHGEELVFSLD